MFFFFIHNKCSCEQTQFVFFKEHFLGKLLLRLILQQYYNDNNALIATSLSFCHHSVLRQGLIHAILHSELLSCQIC